MIHPQLSQQAADATAASEKKSHEMEVQIQPQSSHLKMGVHGVEQPAFSLNKDSFLTTGAAGPQEQSKITIECSPF